VTTCLLCPAPAVADGLCVDDGARLWAATWWTVRPAKARLMVAGAQYYTTHGSGIGIPIETLQLVEQRMAALRDLSTPALARDFLDRLSKAQEERKAALCSRGCVSHGPVNSYGGAEESDDGA
jgi:hypothetical protein